MRRHADPSPAAGPFDRLLGLFTDVHPGEGARATVMLLNIFLILVSYYVIKTVREPLILVGTVPNWMQSLGVKTTAEVSAYAAAGQALLMMVFVPAYSWFASRVDRMKLVFGVTLFFVVNIVLFALAVQWNVKYIGVFFYVWVGLFNMSIVAQFWSYANDTYTKDAGHRLFPIIGVGMTAGAPFGSWLAARMFDDRTPAHVPLYIAAALLLATGVLYEVANRRASVHHGDVGTAPIGGKSAFSLVFRSRYVGLIALLVVLLNYVNSMGEFLLRKQVVAYASQAAAADPAFDQTSFVGGFAGRYMFWVSVLAVLLQVFAAPRLVKRFRLTGVLFALPFIALGAYGLIAFGTTFAVVRWAKTAENSTDYSIMNTARQLLWLPTTREEKYKAKQAVDTFFVRVGDVTMAFVVFLGTSWLSLGIRSFAALNVLVVIAWLAVAAIVLRENHRLSAERAAEKVVA
jgi:ATP:ADP antiporter, AAA family